MTHSTVNSGQTEREAWDVALDALDDYQRNWDTGLPAEYASGERIAMECAVEAVREALNEARAASPATATSNAHQTFESWAAQRFPAKCLSTKSNSREMDEAREFAREGWEAARAAAPQGLTDKRIRAKTLDSMLAKIDGLLCDRMKSDPHGTLDMALETARNVRALLAEQSAAPMADEPRNVEGMTRAEFQDHLRVCLQHDNVRRHERGIPQMTQDEMDSEIRERVERSYPSSAYDYSPRCPGCAAFDSDASEVHFVQGCEGCKARMQKIAGFGPLTADPLPRASEQADEAAK